MPTVVGSIPPEESLIERLRKRAAIRRSIKTRKSVQEGKTDRLADMLEEAALQIEILRSWIKAEGDRGDTCTLSILGEMCEGCRCGKAKK